MYGSSAHAMNDAHTDAGMLFFLPTLYCPCSLTEQYDYAAARGMRWLVVLDESKLGPAAATVCTSRLMLDTCMHVSRLAPPTPHTGVLM